MGGKRYTNSDTLSGIQPDDGGEIAPRTVLALDAAGRLLIFVADGTERSEPPVGLTLAEAAEWVAALGAVHALNMDGGGSSVAVVNGTVASVPHCTDQPGVVCERPVTTVLCVLG